jgi:nucleotide-binding universal stress UspA family protein
VLQFIVPVDGSSLAWSAVDVAVALARQCNGDVDVVQVVFDPDEMQDAELSLHAQIRDVDSFDVNLVPVVRLADSSVDNVAAEICAIVASQPGATVVMSSQGRGRSVAVVGSVAEDLLRCLDGPVVVVGPRSGVPDFSNPMIVTLDGSDFSQAALPIAASWSNQLGPRPTLVRVVERNSSRAADDTEIEQYLASMSGLLSKLTKHQVPYTLQHHHDVEVAVCAHASNIEASLIVTSTHGHTGMARFVLGSTAAAFVRDAPCPVLLVRPAHTDPTEALPRTRR